MSILNSIADAIRDLVDRLGHAWTTSRNIGEGLYHVAVKTGDVTDLTEIVKYVRMLELAHLLLAKLDKAIAVLMRAKEFKLDSRLVELADQLEGLFLEIKDLEKDTVASVARTLTLANRLSVTLGALSDEYHQKRLEVEARRPKGPAAPAATGPADSAIQPADSAAHVEQPAVPVAGAVEPQVALTEAAAGEDFDTAVNAAGNATAPIPVTPPAPPAPPVP